MCDLVNLLFSVLNMLLFIRALLSWVNPDPYNPIVQFIYQLTEPILLPFRRFVPPVGMLDISFIVAIIALQLVRSIVLSVLAQSGLCFY